MPIGGAQVVDKKAEILRCARELFSSRGFKDTNVADIMKAAGFGTGTFYNYYSSKDELFMEIYLEENAKLKRKIMDAVDLDADPPSVMRQVMLMNLSGMNANPILNEWYNHDTFGKIERKFRQAHGLEHIDFLCHGFTDLVKRWQDEGKMRSDIDPSMIMAIFGALLNVEMHKEEIGFQYFPHLLDYLAEFTMDGLTRPVR